MRAAFWMLLRAWWLTRVRRRSPSIDARVNELRVEILDRSIALTEAGIPHGWSTQDGVDVLRQQRAALLP